MTYKSPEEFIEAMRTALNRGDFYAAQQLSFEAIEQYPDHAEVKKVARILAPPVITTSQAPPGRNLWINQDWIKQNRMQYRGQWVALKDGQLLAHGKNIDELVEQVGEIKGTGIFVTAVY